MAVVACVAVLAALATTIHPEPARAGTLPPVQDLINNGTASEYWGETWDLLTEASQASWAATEAQIAGLPTVDAAVAEATLIDAGAEASTIPGPGWVVGGLLLGAAAGYLIYDWVDSNGHTHKMKVYENPAWDSRNCDSNTATGAVGPFTCWPGTSHMDIRDWRRATAYSSGTYTGASLGLPATLPVGAAYPLWVRREAGPGGTGPGIGYPTSYKNCGADTYAVCYGVAASPFPSDTEALAAANAIWADMQAVSNMVGAMLVQTSSYPCWVSGGNQATGCYAAVMSDDAMQHRLNINTNTDTNAGDSASAHVGTYTPPAGAGAPNTGLATDPFRPGAPLATPCGQALLNWLLDPAHFAYTGCTSTDPEAPGAEPNPGSGATDPIQLPQPQIDETYADYLARLRAAGFTGTITEDDLTADQAVPQMGPNAVPMVTDLTGVKTYFAVSWPSPGPMVIPTDSLQLHKNPGDLNPAPDPGAVIPPPGGTKGNCSCPPLDLGPIEHLNAGTQFPFGIWTWIHDAYAGIGSSPLSINLPYSDGSGKTLSEELGSTTWEDTYRPRIFAVVEFLLTLLAIIAVARWGLGLSGDHGE